LHPIDNHFDYLTTDFLEFLASFEAGNFKLDKTIKSNDALFKSSSCIARPANEFEQNRGYLNM